MKLATATKYFGMAEQYGQAGADRKARRKARNSYEKALPLLEELRALTRGDTTYERVSYMYAKSYFGIKDYILGGYYLEDFTRTFPASQYAEECAFLTALCYYPNRPEHELDQTGHEHGHRPDAAVPGAVSRLPRLKDSCNTLIDSYGPSWRTRTITTPCSTCAH